MEVNNDNNWNFSNFGLESNHPYNLQDNAIFSEPAPVIINQNNTVSPSEYGSSSRGRETQVENLTTGTNQSLLVDQKDCNSEYNENNSKKRLRSDSSGTNDNDCDDDGQTCPICLDNWTNSGEHRICSLKCGHLFGYSCIIRWLQSQLKKSCPTCKKKVTKNDVRFIYAKKLIAVDSAEVEEIKEKLDVVIEERNNMQIELSKYICREHSLNQEINLLKSQMSVYKNNPLLYSTSSLNLPVSQQSAKVKLYIDKVLEVCSQGGCRVFDSNPALDLIMVNVKSPNTLFAGFGLRKISISQFKPTAFLPLHTAQIRDISFQGTKVLTVSMDKTLKITDSVSNSNICFLSQTMPLWSSCWDSVNNNCFYIGTQGGSVIKYDIRNLSQPLNILEVPGDLSPVVSVAHVPPRYVNNPGSLPRDGVLSCNLNSLWFFENTQDGYRNHLLTIDGPFYSMRFEQISKQLLVSSRPNLRNPNSRHSIGNFTIENDKIKTNIIHTFDSSGIQRYLSRSCFVKGENSEFVAVHEESRKVITLWNINNGEKATSAPVHEPVLDLSPVRIGCNNSLVGLTERKMLFYKFV